MQPRKHESTKKTCWRLRGGSLVVPAALALLVTGWLGHAAAASRSFLWKVTADQHVVYLVGSVHLLTSDYYPLNPALDAAFADSNLLVEEVDLGEMLAPDAQMQTLMRGMLPANQTVDKVISPETFALVNTTASDLGVPVEPLKRFKPWMLALSLLALEWHKAGFDAELGLDQHFYDRAKTEGKPVQGLETIDYQIARFDEMSMSQQDHLLAESLKELDTETASVTALADAWKAGDAPTVERIVLQDLKSDPDLYQRLLVDRNRNWLPKIDALLHRPGRALVVVGAAHLVGPDGLLQSLRGKGYSVEQM